MGETGYVTACSVIGSGGLLQGGGDWVRDGMWRYRVVIGGGATTGWERLGHGKESFN